MKNAAYSGWWLALVVGCCALGGSAVAKTPEETLAAILGTYDGAWEMFAIDGKGEVVSLARWTDTITLQGPVKREPTRIFATAVDAMTFPGAPTPRTVSFIEGFAIAPDGAVAGRFFDFGGARTDLVALPDGSMVFDSPVTPRDLQSMGFEPAKVVSAHHTTTKHITTRDGLETEWITRVTTVQTDSTAVQFVSMKGHHTRRK